MKMTRKVLVAGLGLIRGSLAKAMRKDEQNYVIGYDLDEGTLEYALEEQIVHEVTDSIEAVINKIDVMIIATPISSTIELLKKIDEIAISKQVIVIDVSSVKGSYLNVANDLQNNNFIF